MEYNFENLKEDLSIGLEIEFIYNGERYSISHNPQGTYLTKYTDWKNYQIFEDWKELLNEATIDGKMIEEIWDSVTDVY